MPRRPDALNENTYHFKVTYFDELHEKEVEKLFRTQKEIGEVFKISRSTIYNYYMNLAKGRAKQNIHKIEKLTPPIQRFKKIVVEFD
tara:strand:- start:603 stop:863 length:261 start_codon:yes stop_codon:yes gene_type:complete